MSKQGVAIKAGRPAKASKSKRRTVVTMPVAGAEVGPPLAATARGALKLRAKKRRATLRGFEVVAGNGATVIKAGIGGKRLRAFKVDGALAAVPGDSGELALGSSKLTLTRQGARALKQRLKLDRLPAATLGRSRASVVPEATEPPPPEPEQYPYEAECPVGTSSGLPGGPGEAEPAAAPPALDLPQPVAADGSSIQWGFLDSFRGYVLNAPPPGTIQTLEGATASGPNLTPPGSYVSYPVEDGSYEAGDETDRSDDRLVAEAGGTTLFCKSGHFFNVVTANPTAVIDGEDSRLVMDVGANMGGTWHPFQRVDVAELDLSGITPELSDSGDQVTFADIPATMTEEGATALGLDAYPAGTELDPVTVTVALERPFADACTLPSDGGATPAVDFGLDPLPVLTGPSAESGTIEWGVRRALRNTVQNGGGASAFTYYGGTVASHPGNMGGAAGPPPTGGDGKFFGFPISSATYDEGDPGVTTDDRLVARSQATVVFCNVNFGSYGLAISKPTLVIDGADSRLTANAYSFRQANWAGGRVDLVSLDASGVTPTIGATSVSWDDVPVTGLTTTALALANLSPPSTTGWDPVSVSVQLPG